MQTRFQLQHSAPESFNALFALEKHIGTLGLDPVHRELIKIRASQINGCAYCINMHTLDAARQGETQQRLNLIAVWREADVFTDAEKALLAFTESITNIQQHVPDAVYAEAARHFEPQYLSAILMAAIAINAWNRMAITTGLRAS